MFTGLVAGQGIVQSLQTDGPGLIIEIRPCFETAAPIELGESIAVNGCCLTVIEASPESIPADRQEGQPHSLCNNSARFSLPSSNEEEVQENSSISQTTVPISHSWRFAAGSETLSRTNLGRLAIGDRVNLEQALPADGRFGGHIVQGHVDGLGTIDRREQEGEWITQWTKTSAELTQYMVPKGSVTLDGVSLTLVDVEAERFSIALIPHTLEVTTLGQKEIGATINIETDILAKYAQKWLAPYRSAPLLVDNER